MSLYIFRRITDKIGGRQFERHLLLHCINIQGKYWTQNIQVSNHKSFHYNSTAHYKLIKVRDRLKLADFLIGQSFSKAHFLDQFANQPRNLPKSSLLLTNNLSKIGWNNQSEQCTNSVFYGCTYMYLHIFTYICIYICTYIGFYWYRPLCRVRWTSFFLC